MRFMQLPNHKPGYCWQNVAPLGESPIWQEAVAPWNGQADDSKLFGLRADIFMMKQGKA